MKNTKKSSFIKWFTLFIIFCLCAYVLFWYFFKDSSKETYNTTTITKGDIENVVTATGSIFPKTSVDIGSQASGQVLKIYAEVGDLVSSGQLLAQIDSRVLKTKVESTQADLRYQEAQLEDKEAALELAQINFERQEKLLEKNATSLDSYQKARASLLQSNASIRMIEAQIEHTNSLLKEHQTNLEYTHIYATMNGTVSTIETKEGQTLNANQNIPTILTISDLKTVTVKASVSEADVRKLFIGMDVYFNTMGSSHMWKSKITKIEPTPTIDNNVVLYNVLFDVDNSADELMTSMTAQVFFILSDAKDAILAPITAVDMDDDESTGTVMLLQNEKLESREVQVGINNRVEIEILSGLKKGDEVLTRYTDAFFDKKQSKKKNQKSALTNSGRR